MRVVKISKVKYANFFIGEIGERENVSSQKEVEYHKMEDIEAFKEAVREVLIMLGFDQQERMVRRGGYPIGVTRVSTERPVGKKEGRVIVNYVIHEKGIEVTITTEYYKPRIRVEKGKMEEEREVISRDTIYYFMDLERHKKRIENLDKVFGKK